MKTATLETLFYAIKNVDTGELVEKYSGGYLWQRKGDAETKARQLLNSNHNARTFGYRRNLPQPASDYEILTVVLHVAKRESMSTIVAAEKIKEAEKQKIEKERAEKINILTEKLKELTGTKDIPTIKTFLVKNLVVPDYKIQIENVFKELEQLKYSKIK